MKKIILVAITLMLLPLSANAQNSCKYNPYNPPDANYGGIVNVGDTVGHFSTLKSKKGSLYGQIESLTCRGTSRMPIARIRITDCSGFCGTRDPESKVLIKEGTILQAPVVAKPSSPSFGDFASWAVTH